jgi:hypothetical protein
MFFLLCFVDLFAPISLSDVQMKARKIAGSRVPADFQFSAKWLYGFLRFFRVTCRIAADSASSDRLDVSEIDVLLLPYFTILIN